MQEQDEQNTLLGAKKMRSAALSTGSTCILDGTTMNEAGILACWRFRGCCGCCSLVALFFVTRDDPRHRACRSRAMDHSETII